MHQGKKSSRMTKTSLKTMALLLCLLTTATVKAQLADTPASDSTAAVLARLSADVDFIKRFKFSGYIQAQAQFADSSIFTAGSKTQYNPRIDKRVSVRRGRLKMTYEQGPAQVVFQTDMTERGLRIVESYLRLTEPNTNWFSLTAGIFNRPFGFEVPYSSSLRESPERGTMSLLLFPNERDLGAMITVQGPKTGIWNWIRLDAGLFTGVGSPDANKGITDIDKRKDLISRLSFNRSTANERFRYSGGVSIYIGGPSYQNDTTYVNGTDSAGTHVYVAQKVSAADYADRKYYGADLQLSYDWKLGATTIRGEYITGDQPALTGTTRSVSDALTIGESLYNRKFSGAYFYFVQNITRLKLQAVVKYDFYDPNTDVSGDQIGKSTTAPNVATNGADIRFSTIGYGLNYLFDAHTKLMVYYESVTNETSANLAGFNKNRLDDILTVRLQYKF